MLEQLLGVLEQLLGVLEQLLGVLEQLLLEPGQLQVFGPEQLHFGWR